MSIDSAQARIVQIQALVAAAAKASPAPGFDQKLQEAQSSSAHKSGPKGPQWAEDLIARAAKKHGVDPSLIRAVMRAESNFDPNAGSSAGAQGLMQLMPSTARGLGVTNPSDPWQNVDAGVKYLKEQLDKFGKVDLALAAYNAGPGAVQKFSGVPPYPETQAYVKKIMAELGL